MRRVLAGDREAFRLIVLRYQGLLNELVFRQTGDRSGTEDMVQETFLRAYKALDRYDSRFRLSTWLARIALNVARDSGRRKKVRQDAPPQFLETRREIVDPLEAAASSEARAAVSRALSELPENQREAVVLSIYGGLSQREISETLQIPLGTVKTRHRSAFRRLRELVAPLHPGGAA